MSHPKVLALILAGGAGSRLGVLTDERAKPAMPFGGMYRLIDFSLSNCLHSKLSDVWVIEQYQLHSLNEHLANGRPWDLDRTHGGLQILPPFEANRERAANDRKNRTQGGFAEGNADAIYRHLRLLREFNPDLLLVLSADHVYKLDYREVIDFHLRKKADVTLVTTKVELEKATRFGSVIVGEKSRVTGFDYKPEKPKSPIVTTEVFVYSAPVLFEMLDKLSGENSVSNQSNNQSTKKKSAAKKSAQSAMKKSENGSTELEDFGHQLLPAMIKKGNAYEYRLKTYWRDLGTVRSYWHSHIELLAEKPGLELDDPQWRICTLAAQRLPARIYASAQIDDSLISPGCIVRGRVVRSVLAPGVTVEANSTIEDSVVLHDAHIETGAHVTAAIIDNRARIGAHAIVGAKVDDVEAATDEDITVIGAEALISAQATVKPQDVIKPRAHV